MRVAVTAREASVDSQVDQRFGRAQHIIVVDTETGSAEAHGNELNMNAAQGAGIQTAQNVAQLGVGAVLTGHVGPNAFRALSAAGIEAYTGLDGTVAQAIEALRSGKLSPTAAADVEGHW